jgi:20S proteasome subunit beta 2
MKYTTTNNEAPRGFSFENIHRNTVLEKLAAATGQTKTMPRAKKTGTTITGLVFDKGVVLGADTRATNGEEVAEKNCEKIHNLAPNIYCCGAGTAADTEKTTDMVRSNLALLRLSMHGEPSRVITACTQLKRFLFRYQGHISAALVLGGCDIHGPAVYQIYPHGSTGKLPYTTMGSGSLAAMSVFESEWRSGLNEEEAKALVQKSIRAGIFNDLGSGSNVDLCVIRTDGTVSYLRNYEMPNDPQRDRIVHSDRFTMRPGTTPILHMTTTPHLPTVKEQYATLEDVTVQEMEVEG